MIYHISNAVGVDADIKMMSTSMNGHHLKQKVSSLHMIP